MMFSGSIHLPANDNISFFFIEQAGLGEIDSVEELEQLN
jgi:hypothetical protein